MLSVRPFKTLACHLFLLPRLPARKSLKVNKLSAVFVRENCTIHGALSFCSALLWSALPNNFFYLKGRRLIMKQKSFSKQVIPTTEARRLKYNYSVGVFSIIFHFFLSSSYSFVVVLSLRHPRFYTLCPLLLDKFTVVSGAFKINLALRHV